MNEPDIVVSHANCADGMAAAWAIRQRWPQVPVVFANYGDDPPDVTGKRVLLVDFSYPEPVLREMAESAIWLYVCDHHKTAEGFLRALSEPRESGAPLIGVTFDLEQSGAALAWQYAWGAGRPLPMLIQHVQDRDLWRFKMDGAREIHAVLTSYPWDFEIWTRLAKRLEDPAKRMGMIEEGSAILRAQDVALDAILNACAHEFEMAGHEVLIANVPPALASEAGNRLAEGRPFAMTYFDRADGARVFSLRSRPGGEDVSEIAKQVGGGGHKHAAGFTVSPWPWPRSGEVLNLEEDDPPAVDDVPLAMGVGKIPLAGASDAAK